MSPGKPTNLPASVSARLRNLAGGDSQRAQDVHRHYVHERFLYRLSQSRHAGRFVLKGAQMMLVWGGRMSRATRDIDLLCFGPNDVDAVVAAVSDICACPVEPDGVEFDANNVRGEVITEDAEYKGARVLFRAFIGTARIPMQIDIGFGDALVPPAEEITYPTHLEGFPAPKLRGYRREASIAEKLHAMISKGSWNSRMKDFYDIWALSREFEFDGPTVAEAIDATFASRSTDLHPDFHELAQELIAEPNKQTQWGAFLRKRRLPHAPAQFSDAMDAIELFLGPAVEALVEGRAFAATWAPPGPWVRR